MIDKKGIHKELINEEIFVLKIDNNLLNKYIFLNKGYYCKNELLQNIEYGVPIKKFGRKIYEYSELISRTRQTTYSYILSGKVIFLQIGYYDKEKFINYLKRKNEKI